MRPTPDPLLEVPRRPPGLEARAADADMAVRRYRPRRLSGLVAAIWEQRAESPASWRILPSGWVELLFRLGPAFELRSARRLDPSSSAIRAFCFLSGLHTRPLDVALESYHMFGVQLHPVAVRAYFGVPCSEVLDGAVEGDLVVGDLARVEDHLRAAPTFEARARWMERELEARLCASDRADDALRMWRLAAHIEASTAAPAGAVVQRLGYSRTHAHRLFGEWFGQSATGTLRLGRFVRALEGVHAPRPSLTAVGLEAGYFDQAHFIRDFRAFAGMTPGEYRRRSGPEPGHLPL